MERSGCLGTAITVAIGVAIMLASRVLFGSPFTILLYLAAGLAVLILGVVLVVQAECLYQIARMGRLNRARRVLAFHQDLLFAYGWYVELDGKRIGKLTAGTWSDMFKDVYRLSPLAYDLERVRAILADPDQDEMLSRVEYRSRLVRVVADGAFPCIGSYVDAQGSTWITMRSLRLYEPRTVWDLCQLWWKRQRLREIRRTLVGPS